MTKENALFDIADKQQGYFTTKQALNCGYHPTDFARLVAKDLFIKEMRGIFRLRNYPSCGYLQDLVPLSMWSNDREGEPQGTFCYATACSIHDLDLRTTIWKKNTMMVPKLHCVRKKTPNTLELIRCDLEHSEREFKYGYYVTTVIRTLYDIVEHLAMWDGAKVELLIQSTIKEGKIGAQEALSLFTYYGEHIEEKS